MHQNVYALLNIKPAEQELVRQLFLVQLFLGIATAFLFTSTLTLFLHTFDAHYIPRVYLLTAALLLIANWVYSKLEHHYSARTLHERIILFSGASLVITWAGMTFFENKWLPFLLSGWNMVVYMLVGYAFWGMAAIIFNVRQSKRLFALVGAGDLPAKLIGYALVPVLIPYLGVHNLLWLSVVAFGGAYYFLQQLKHPAIHEIHHTAHPAHHLHARSREGFFRNNLILCIAGFSLIAFTIYALIDYTLLVEIKARFTDSPELAIFIGVFFAAGRVLAIFFKVLFSSRLISNLGLSNSLLISPLVLLLVTGFLFLPGESEQAVLYTFGIMVLCSEILKSVVQEPAFFILFQPLQPQVRLKGHLIAKGYMLPFALSTSGLFLLTWGNVSILLIGQVLVVLLLLWAASVFLVKSAYLHTLVQSIRNGWFSGTTLFLNNASVKELLLKKVNSHKPGESIMALELLERSGFQQVQDVLLNQVESEHPDVRRYALERLLHRGNTALLPHVVEQLSRPDSHEHRPVLLRAYYSLVPGISASEITTIDQLTGPDKKAALTGLLLRNEPKTEELVYHELWQMIQNGSRTGDKLLALEVIADAPGGKYKPILEEAISSGELAACKRAMEVAGVVKCVELLEKVVTVATARNTNYALQKALVNYGDDVFKADILASEKLPPAILKTIVAAAAKIKGAASTNYLLMLLKNSYPFPDELVAALWQKQAQLTTGDVELLKYWLDKKLHNCRYKIAACQEAASEPVIALLCSALQSELKQDLQQVLKGLALCYDRERVDRVSKLLQIGDSGKVANAIETLEHLLPKHLFKHVELLLDFVMEGSVHHLYPLSTSKEPTAGLLAKVIKGEKPACSTWTRAVACYLVPAAASPALWQLLAADNTLPQEPLFRETKAHVLAELT